MCRIPCDVDQVYNTTQSEIEVLSQPFGEWFLFKIGLYKQHADSLIGSCKGHPSSSMSRDLPKFLGSHVQRYSLKLTCAQSNSLR